MKDKILYLIIGILVGAMITTGVFMVLNNNNNNQDNFERRTFDANNLPDDFDPNSMPQGGPGGNRGTNETNTNAL